MIHDTIDNNNNNKKIHNMSHVCTTTHIEAHTYSQFLFILYLLWVTKQDFWVRKYKTVLKNRKGKK